MGPMRTFGTEGQFWAFVLALVSLGALFGIVIGWATE